MEVRAILVTGGLGTRLLPFTAYTQKSLLPIFDRPVLDYCLATIRAAGIDKITIISNKFIDQIAHHIGSGIPGEQIQYVIESDPKGVLPAISLARSHHQDCRMLVYFSDNITTENLKDEVERFTHAVDPPGCVMLGRKEVNPEAFGVAVFDGETLVDVVEKPQHPPSNIAIGGIYLYDETFWSKFDHVMSKEPKNNSISDINRIYIKESKAKLLSIGTDTWLDCGSPDSLLKAANLAKEGKLRPNSQNK
ncbi:MAG: sugar phosphate nucleotidyltransferase [archaeon]|nr:sugar phosphate nucleotidyltransferase [archaeon]MDA1167383.1 sugar phosphate nucleotidyltransferase [archaeon]